MNFEDIYSADLLNKKKETVKGDILKGKLLLFYFSAHWFPPCRSFTPVLRDFYTKAVKEGKQIAIVFITSDKDEASCWDYFSNDHGDYYVLPFAAQDLSKCIKKKYGITGIPSLVVVKENGDVIDAGARSKVTQECDTSCIDDWMKQK